VLSKGKIKLRVKGIFFLFIIFFLLVVNGGTFSLPQLKAEEKCLQLNWKKRAFFQENNLFPGDTIEEELQVENITSFPQKIGLKVTPSQGTGQFLQQFWFTIKKEGREIKSFFLAPDKEFLLTTLEGGEKANWQFQITFQPQRDHNQWQGEKIKFDLILGCLESTSLSNTSTPLLSTKNLSSNSPTEDEGEVLGILSTLPRTGATLSFSQLLYYCLFFLLTKF